MLVLQSKHAAILQVADFYENIPRMLPEGMKAVVKKDSYEVPAIFKLLAEEGDIAEEMMYNTFNMGLGMVVAVDKEDVDKTMEAIKAAGDTPYIVGHMEAGEKGELVSKWLKVAVLVSVEEEQIFRLLLTESRMEVLQMPRLML